MTPFISTLTCSFLINVLLYLWTGNMESHVLEVKQSLYARLRQSELMWCKISTSYRNRKHHWLLLICCCSWCSSRLLHGNLTLGKIEHKAFSSKTPKADRTAIVFDKQMDTKITQDNSHYTIPSVIDLANWRRARLKITFSLGWGLPELAMRILKEAKVGSK